MKGCRSNQPSNRVAGTYTGVTGTSSGSGRVGKFDVTVGTGGNVSDVTVTNAGYGHTVGDVITIADADLGWWYSSRPYHDCCDNRKY